ncbi:MAG: pitrilysin family protein [Acidobacteria bacterium]|nr:pitrilysin family protein [Acidobacteriota bacterium]
MTRREPPVTGPDEPVVFPPVTRIRLANGLAVWFVERRQLPFVTVSLLVPAGSAIDPIDLPGLASLTADMLDEGSGTQSAIEIQEAFGRLGTTLDTEAGPDAVLLSLSVLPRHAHEACALIADLVMRPTLAVEDFERVSTLRLNRLRQLRNSPSSVADQAFVQAVFGAHPYGHQPWGLTQAIERMHIENVVHVHEAAYHPASCAMMVVGSLEPADVARIAESAFGTWTGPEKGSDLISTIPFSPAPRASASRVILVDRPGAAQTELRIGHVAAPRGTPDYHALVLLNAILGGQFVSRINLNLREQKGYTYGAHTAFDFRRMAGSFVLQTSVQTDATADAVRESLNEIAAIRGDRPPTAQEIEFGSATLTRGYARSFETTGQIGRALTQLAMYDLPDDTFDRFVPGVRAVRADDLTAAAQRYLHPDQLVVVAVGDRVTLESGLASLGLGDPVVATVDI